MKYKTIRDLPFFPAGTEWQEDSKPRQGTSVHGRLYGVNMGAPQSFPLAEMNEWLEEVEGWKPAWMEDYYYVSSDLCSVLTHRTTGQLDAEHVRVGNCFKTSDEAEELARRWAECAKKYSEELNK